MELFNQILFDLGELIQLPLYPDKNQTCRLMINQQMPVYLEMDPTGERLLVGAGICEIPPGKFREDVLKEALKANNEPAGQVGSLSYTSRENKLSLYEFLPAKSLDGEKLANYLENFIAHALEWKKAIEGGSPAPVVKPIQQQGNNPPPYGLKP